MPATETDLFARLDELGIAHKTVRHEPLFTVKQSQAISDTIPGGHSKNLFLKDKKGRLWLVVAREDLAIDLKRLHTVIGSARLSFGSSELLEEMLGIKPGSVTPFALINDTEHRVTVILDRGLVAHQQVNFHPLNNEATTTVSNDGLIAFIRACGHEPVIIDLPERDAAGND